MGKIQAMKLHSVLALGLLLVLLAAPTDADLTMETINEDAAGSKNGEMYPESLVRGLDQENQPSKVVPETTFTTASTDTGKNNQCRTQYRYNEFWKQCMCKNGSKVAPKDKCPKKYGRYAQVFSQKKCKCVVYHANMAKSCDHSTVCPLGMKVVRHTNGICDCVAICKKPQVYGGEYTWGPKQKLDGGGCVCPNNRKGKCPAGQSFVHKRCKCRKSKKSKSKGPNCKNKAPKYKGCNYYRNRKGGKYCKLAVSARRRSWALDAQTNCKSTCHLCALSSPPPPRCTGKVEVYQHGDFTGWKASFAKGVYDYGKFVKAGAKNDDASSIKVPTGCKATLYQHGDFKGWKAVFPAGHYPYKKFVKRAKNDDASAIKVRNAIMLEVLDADEDETN